MYLNQIAASLVPGRRHSSLPFISPSVSRVFKVGANVGSVADFSYESPFVDLVHSLRAFAAIGGDSYTNVPLDANGYPTTDFSIVLAYATYSASTAQVLKCQMLGSCASISVTVVAGITVTNLVVTGDNMTFDINVPAGVYSYPCTLAFNNTKRTAVSSVNTGCSGLVVKQPGYSIADTTEFMPLAVAFNSRYGRLRFMDWSGVNGNVTTINPADRASDTHRLTNTSSIEQCCRFSNLVGNKDAWFNIPIAASDALITALGAAANATLGAGQNIAFQLSNEVWNYAPGFYPQHNYAMLQALTIANGFSASFNTYGRGIVSAVRASNVTTITTSAAHNYVATQPVGINGIGSVAGIVAVIATPTTTTFTIADTGVDGAVSIGGSSSVVGNCSTSYPCSLNSYDHVYDQFNLQKRWTAKRTVEMATLLSAVFGGLGTRCKVVYMDAPGNGSSDQMLYVNTVHGSPSSFITAIGNATYYYLDATQYSLGGNNLQDVTTFGGNTPPLVSDYIAALTLTAGVSQVNDVYDDIAITAKTWGLKAWQYEHGPNMNTANGSAGTGRDTQKQAAMDDPTFATPYRRPFTDLESHGFEEVMIYYSGTRDNYIGDNTCWPTANTYATPTTTKTTTLDAIIAAIRTGPTRNLLASTGTTVISGASDRNRYLSSGQNNGDLDLTKYVISSPTARSYSLTLNITTTDNIRQAYMLVNGTIVNQYNFTTVGTGINTAAVAINLNAGINVIQFAQVSGGYIGGVVKINSLSFN